MKKSTAQLKPAAETLCAFLNSGGGRVVIGVTPEGRVVGQQVSDKTQRDIAGVIGRFEPPAPVEIEYVDLSDSNSPNLKLIVLSVARSRDAGPFSFDGRSYQRIGTATSLMPQETYEKSLLERMHVRHRWENQPADGIGLGDLVEEEIMRTAERGASSGRLPETAGAGELLDRLGLRIGGSISNAAVVLFGGRLFPQYPQCQLRMARFKGYDKTEFLDNRQVNGNSFQLLDEAMLFLWRHLPVAGRIQPGLFERVDEPLFPPVALREALTSASRKATGIIPL